VFALLLSQSSFISSKAHSSPRFVKFQKLKDECHVSNKSQELYPCENGVYNISEFISRNSRVIEIYGRSDQSMMQLKIHDQSMTVLTMQTKNSRTHPKGWCIEPKFTRARNLWPIHAHADDADQKRKNRSREAGASNQSWHVPRQENLNKTRNQSELTTTEWTYYEKMQWTKDGTFPKY